MNSSRCSKPSVLWRRSRGILGVHVEASGDRTIGGGCRFRIAIWKDVVDKREKP